MEGLSFSRQHNVRFRGFNGTHELISILDNAHGQDDQKPTSKSSRGLVMALDVKNKVARIVSKIDHPYGRDSYAPRRGNYQVMDNGHIFMGWSEQATHSEHDAHGKLLMSASLLTEWLGTYRSYKFPFVGRPSEAPRAVSAAYASPGRNSTTTMVHVSWNGATEVDQYKLYKTTETGQPKIPIFQKKKTGYETALTWDGYASYVIVEALDKRGKVLGATAVAKTLDPPAEAMSEAVAEEIYWLQEMHGENDGWKDSAYYDSAGGRTWTGSFGLVLFGSVLAILLFFLGWRLKARGYFRTFQQRYQALADRDPGREEQDPEEGGELDDRYPPKRSQGGFRDSSQ